MKPELEKLAREFKIVAVMSHDHDAEQGMRLVAKSPKLRRVLRELVAQ